MNKKGFTLVELLAVIIILALMTTIISIAVVKIVKDSRSDLSDIQKKNIESAARTWAGENINMLPSEGTCGYLKLEDLENSGYIDSNIVDTKTGETLSETMLIKISNEINSKGNYVIKYQVNPSNSNECSYIYMTCTIADLENMSVGDEVACGSERFYVLNIDQSVDNVSLLAKYNLYIGVPVLDIGEGYVPVIGPKLTEADPGYGIQNSSATGMVFDPVNFFDLDSLPWYGGSVFVLNSCEEYGCAYGYWYDPATGEFKEKYNHFTEDRFVGKRYTHVYDENSNLFQYVDYYKKYLINHGINVIEIRIPYITDAISLGCSSSDGTCASNSWFNSTSYWFGDAYGSDQGFANIINAGILGDVSFISQSENDIAIPIGIRPVIVISKSDIEEL